MKRRLLSFLVLCMSVVAVWAQDAPADSAKSASGFKFSLENAAVQAHAGTQGFGVAARYAFLPNLSARLGASFGSVKIEKGISFDNLSSDNTLKAEASNMHLWAEFSPISWLRINAGAGYFFKAEATMETIPNESVTQDGITLEPEEIGKLTTTATYKEFAPYFGLGFGRGIPQGRFNVNVDLGTYYLSAPSVTMVGTEYLADNGHNGPILERNMKDYRWLPVLQLNLTFKFSK
ncbi:hypothetical protein [Pedobacter faecalis]|uniref:hypothetical protein n=1 Tax=Pedobacter faecalis TaxID=3041495 RepID=UPI00254BBE0F|nr:hypothetical protein [Pedobacter sp. ELA7]